MGYALGNQLLFLGNWDAHQHRRAGAGRVNLHVTLKLAKTFPQASYSYTRALGLNNGQLLTRHALPLVPHFYPHSVRFTKYADLGHPAAGMAMYIC